MSDVLLELVRTLVVGGIVAYLVYAGRHREDLARRGWSLILTGFILLLFGCALDITDNFETLNGFVVVGDTHTQAFLEKIIGFLGGFLFIAVGLLIWIPTVAGVEQLERVSRELELANLHLESANDELARVSEQLCEQNAHLSMQVRTDDLTGVLSRGAWETEAHLAAESLCRQQKTYGILMLDIDRFKLLNDTAGHPYGDECLKQVAQALIACSRSRDLIGRLGGEEFAVFIPDADQVESEQIARRIREHVRGLEIANPGLGPERVLTVSLGVALGRTREWRDVLSAADAALYEAKRAGRDRVQTAPPLLAA